MVFLMFVSSISTYLLPPLLTGKDLAEVGAVVVGADVVVEVLLEAGGATATEHTKIIYNCKD